MGRPLDADTFTFTLAGGGAAGVTARDGVTALDAEWANGADAFPSGDGNSGGVPGGASGGDFQFRTNVLPGDANRNRRVDALDLIHVRERAYLQPNRQRPWLPGYTLFHDVNGDGRVNLVDMVAVRRHIGSGIPPAETPGTATVASVWQSLQPQRRQPLMSPLPPGA